MNAGKCEAKCRAEKVESGGVESWLGRNQPNERGSNICTNKM